MPILNPGTNDHKPRDWRQAYDAFNAFRRAVRTVSTRLGDPIPTDMWAIIVPGRLKHMADPRWQMKFFHLNGHLEVMYIGSNGADAQRTIRKVHEQYIQALINRGPRSGPRNGYKQPGDARQNHGTVQLMRDLWTEMLKAGGRSAAAWNEQVKAHPEVIKFMGSRAGYLDMSMQDYLFKHPMSTRWPTPPRSKAELDARIKQDEHYEQYQQHKHNNQEETTFDPGPGWMG